VKKKFGNTAQIAYEVGLNHPAYFARCFKQLYGVTPFHYEKNMNREAALEK
jgi:AraC-like DNA-binding protein